MEGKITHLGLPSPFCIIFCIILSSNLKDDSLCWNIRFSLLYQCVIKTAPQARGLSLPWLMQRHAKIWTRAYFGSSCDLRSVSHPQFPLLYLINATSQKATNQMSFGVKGVFHLNGTIVTTVALPHPATMDPLCGVQLPSLPVDLMFGKERVGGGGEGPAHRWIGASVRRHIFGFSSYGGNGWC